jgi:hypothetical protein
MRLGGATVTRTMVATEARKARRMAAAAAAAAAEGKTLDAKSLEKAPVKPLPASTPPAHRREPSAQQTRAGVGGPSPTAGTSKTPILKGIGTKAGGKYTPPAILRAVANAARNKETKAGAGPGATAAAEDSSANPSKADWTCVKCGKSNFAKRLACFKCASPKPGRTFTAAGMKGYEKRLARREAKRAAEMAAPGDKTSSIDESSADQSKKSKPAETRPKKTSFDDDAGDDAGDVNGTGDAKDPKKDNKKKRDDDARDKDDKKRKRTPKKASDVGKAPKRLRDPDAHLEYLARWSEAHQERGNGPTKGFKPSNGWKLDKNVQNWLIHNACDPDQVDEDAFDMFTMYAAGLRGGPLGRMRDAAGEENRGKGVKAERARKVLRVLADIVEDADS